MKRETIGTDIGRRSRAIMRFNEAVFKPLCTVELLLNEIVHMVLMNEQKASERMKERYTHSHSRQHERNPHRDCVENTKVEGKQMAKRETN